MENIKLVPSSQGDLLNRDSMKGVDIIALGFPYPDAPASYEDAGKRLLPEFNLDHAERRATYQALHTIAEGIDTRLVSAINDSVSSYKKINRSIVKAAVMYVYPEGHFSGNRKVPEGCKALPAKAVKGMHLSFKTEDKFINAMCMMDELMSRTDLDDWGLQMLSTWFSAKYGGQEVA